MKTKIRILATTSILLIAINATKAQDTIPSQTATSNSQADVAAGGAPKEPVAAVAWYRKAAEQIYAGAQNAVGYCYFNGKGVSKDEAEAVRWYRKAAEQGLEKAKVKLKVLGIN